MLSIFSCACWPSICFFLGWGGCLLRSSAHFQSDFFLILSSLRCLDILDINLLSVVSLANIFSHLVGCLFILLMASIALFLSSTRLHLFIFSFVFFALVDRSKTPLLWFMSRGVLPVVFWSYI